MGTTEEFVSKLKQELLDFPGRTTIGFNTQDLLPVRSNTDNLTEVEAEIYPTKDDLMVNPSNNN